MRSRKMFSDFLSEIEKWEMEAINQKMRPTKEGESDADVLASQQEAIDAQVRKKLLKRLREEPQLASAFLVADECAEARRKYAILEEKDIYTATQKVKAALMGGLFGLFVFPFCALVAVAIVHYDGIVNASGELRSFATKLRNAIGDLFISPFTGLKKGYQKYGVLGGLLGLFAYPIFELGRTIMTAGVAAVGTLCLLGGLAVSLAISALLMFASPICGLIIGGYYGAKHGHLANLLDFLTKGLAIQETNASHAEVVDEVAIAPPAGRRHESVMISAGNKSTQDDTLVNLRREVSNQETFVVESPAAVKPAGFSATDTADSNASAAALNRTGFFGTSPAVSPVGSPNGAKLRLSVESESDADRDSSPRMMPGQTG